MEWGGRGCQENLGVWGPGLPSLHGGLRLGTLPSSREGNESSFYKARSEALGQAPFVDFLCPPHPQAPRLQHHPL